MADRTITARLALNGEQVSAESKRVFAEMEKNGRQALKEVNAESRRTFAQINDIVAKSLSAPRTSAGGLNLDTAAARAAAQAAKLEADAMTEVAAAAERVARSKGTLNTVESARVLALRQAASNSQLAAREAAQYAAYLDTLQAELGQTALATQNLAGQQKLLTNAGGRNNMVMVQASQQFQDFFIQVGNGQSIMVAATQQLSQLAFIMQGTSGAAGKFAALLNGPWGAAIIGGAALIGIFGKDLFDWRTEIEKASDELVEQNRKLAVSEEAKRAYAQSAEGVIEALLREEDALARLNLTMEENIRLTQRQVLEKLKQAETDRATAASDLAEQRKALSAAQAGLKSARGRITAEPADRIAEIAAYEQRIKSLQASIDGLQKRISAADTAMAIARQQYAQQSADFADARARAAVDPQRAIDQKYDDEVARAKQRHSALIAQAGDVVKARKAAEDWLTGELAKIERKRKADSDALRKEAQADRRRDAAETIALLSPVQARISSGYGARAPMRTTNGQRGSAFHAGVDYAVPIGTGVRAGADGIVMHAGDLPGYGKVIIVDYGKGTMAQFAHLSQTLAGKGDVVKAGQVIALSGDTGNVTGPHLDYRVRQGATGVKDGAIIGGSWINPATARVRPGQAGDAVADTEERRRKEMAAWEESLGRLIRAGEQDLDISTESLRLMGLRTRGLEAQAELESEIGRMRRDFQEQIAELSDRDRAAQLQRSEGLSTEIGKLMAQADAYAALIEAAGDQQSMTQAQAAAIDAANAAMLDQLTVARALAKTAQDRQDIEEAIARVASRVGVARDNGSRNAERDRRLADELMDRQKRADEEQYQRQEENIRTLAGVYEDLFRTGGKNIVEGFKDEMLSIISQIAARWTIAMLTGQKSSLGGILQQMGASSGGGGLFGLLGLGGGASGGIGGGVQGTLGGLAGLVGGGASGVSGLGAAAGLGKAGGLLGGISSAVPYIGAALGVFTLFSSLFKRSNWGSASVSLVNGEAVGGSATGYGKNYIGAAGSAAGGVADGVNRLAETLGATITALPGITIGKWKDEYRVALTATSKPLHTKNFGPDILKNFGDDQQGAIEYAVAQAFSKATIEGISQASKTIIANTKDINKAIEKALLIEDIPKRLAARLDPVGYAIDQLNRQWEKTVAALREGNATTEQMAEAQRLYALELADTKAQARDAAASLREFLDGIAFGSASPFSLRDQQAMAKASLQPLLDTIQAGGTVDQGKFTDLAQRYLEIERQLYGSTADYFRSLDMIQAATNKAISAIDNAKPIRTYADPFAEKTAAATQASAELLSSVVSQIAGLRQDISALGGGGGNSFVGTGADPRGFVAESFAA